MDSSPSIVPRLSVAMIVRNCAAQLSATIASIRSIADEIVVLDTGSTDDTLVAAMQAGVNVQRRAWDDDFAAARNSCLEKARGDWILWLDAGETLSTDQAAELRSLVSGGPAPDRAYLLNVTLPAAPGQLGSEQIARLRLHPRREGVRFAGRVRERIDESLAAQNIAIDASPIVIERGDLDHDAGVKTNRAQRNIRLADLDLAEHGPSARLHNVLGEAYQTLGDHVRAAQHFRRSLDLAEQKSREHLEAFYGLLTCLDGVAADGSDQLSLAILALEHFPLDAQLLVALGGYLQNLGQSQFAVRSFDLAFRHGLIESQVWHLPDIRQIAASSAATVLVQSREDDQARTLLEAAVTIYPQSHKLALQLIDLHVRNLRRNEALAVIAGFASAADRERLATAVRGAYLARQGDWSAAADLLQAAVLDGCRERFCLRWLVVSWLALERPLDAQSALRIWQAADPQNDELASFAEQVDAQLDEQAADLSEPIRVDEAAPGVTPPATRHLPSGPTIGTTGRGQHDLADS
jgi:tetratricopeptide (TPR) repeat protein